MKLSGGESGMEATERGMAALASAADRTVLVTHGNLLGLMLKKIDGSYGYEEWKNFSNPDVYQVEIEGAAFQANRIWE